MTTALLPLHHAAASRHLPRGRLSGFGHLLVAAIYALMLVAAPIIVRYAPAPSATAIVTAVAPQAPHADCAAGTHDCGPARAR